MSDAAHPFSLLTPETILAAIESVGMRCDGRLLALNSYENRVYQVGIEDAAPVVAKFYRPDRWTDAQIREEHAFAAELVEDEVPVVAPLEIDGRKTLGVHGQFRFAVYPRRGGRAPELDREDTLQWIGRFIARIHRVGARKKFLKREKLSVERLGVASREFVLSSGFVPAELTESYARVSELAIEAARACFDHVGPVTNLRLHGDCHAGNVLWTDDGPHFVDLDDACTGPAIQDLWMLLSGDRETRERQITVVLEGYEMFRELDRTEILLVEALRTLRMMHYAAWLARRWEDPAFPVAFPWFASPRYWQDHILELREQVAAMDEAPLGA